MSQLQDLYQELIVDHSKNPRNKGKLEDCSFSAEGYNPLCGDRIHLYLKVDENDVIRDVKFEGSGCAISTASIRRCTETRWSTGNRKNCSSRCAAWLLPMAGKRARTHCLTGLGAASCVPQVDCRDFRH